MNQKTLLFLYLITILPFFLASFSARAAMVTGIDFHGTSDPAQVDINTDQPIVFEKTENLENRQIVLDLKGATLPRHIARKIDTSSFNSNVSLISPYQLEGQEGVRVVIQMRKSGGGEVSQDGNNLSIRIPMGAAPDLADKEVTSSTVDTPVAIETAQAGAKTKAAASSLAANSGVEFVDKKSTKLKILNLYEQMQNIFHLKMILLI
ncbi:MAG: AMIN domain-containing protein [Bdellovibrionota bacterium]